MKGMILAAGVGSRLSPLTAAIPKPMVPVAGKPVMEHAVEMLVTGGVREIKANLHHLPHLIEQHFGDGRRWGAHLTYSLESRLLGTAGAVKRVERYFDETFIVTVGDSVWDLDVGAVVDYHRSSGAAVTVVVKPMPAHALSRFGVVRVDGDGRIREFQEKPRPEEACSNLASTGFYVIEPEVLDLVPAGQFFDFARDLFPRVIELGRPFNAFLYEGPWSDIGTFSEYAQVHRDILEGAYSRLRVPPGRDGVLKGHHVEVHPQATVVPPVLLGDHCRILRGATVGPHAVVGSHSIIGEDAHVAEGIVGPRTYVGALLDLRQCVAHGKWLVRLPDGLGVYLNDDTLLATPQPRALEQRVLRGLDVAIGSLGLAASLPVFMVMGLAARLSRQYTIDRCWHVAPDLRCIGPNGTAKPRPYQLLRFSEEGLVGSLSRALGVSRLPGLYNVVRGDISLVGTRPMTADEMAAMPEEWRRHLQRVPAGLTGLWRIEGEGLPPDEVLALDAYYAAHKGLAFDLRLLARAITGGTRLW